MIDIHGGSKDPRAARLSNFTNRPFMFDGIACAGIEGILQALKEPEAAKQPGICALRGKAAKKAENDLNGWKESQTLWWKGVPYERCGQSYQVLITCIYNAVYEQDPTFKEDLLTVELDDICHSIGNPDQRDTVLTEVEMIHQLNRLRLRALRSEGKLPSKKPTMDNIPHYRGVKKDGDPLVFLKRHYADWIALGFLTQVNLRQHDEKLVNSLKYKLRTEGRKLADMVPPGIRR